MKNGPKKTIVPIEVAFIEDFNNSKHHWEGMCDHQKRKMIFTLISESFCISILILKLKMTFFVIQNFYLDETIPNWLQQVK